MIQYVGHVCLKSWCSVTRERYPPGDKEVDLEILVEWDLAASVKQFIATTGELDSTDIESTL